MLLATGALFTLGVALFLWDFFFLAPSKKRPVPAIARLPLTAER